MNSKTTHRSRRVAHLLRHSSLPNRNGWVRACVVQRELSISAEELRQIVEDDTKGRYEFSQDEDFVRALYGHSINVDLGLLSSTPPTTLFHGTADKYISRIMVEGLQPRSRAFVHLSKTAAMAREVGARHGLPIVLAIDAEAMCRDGYKFYDTQRDVWLTDTVAPKYITIFNE
ncbi:MAG: RNA 2'-phosphotransferase [Tidjanibacter sp.]|nr:RNA 2'-phosphotransferase [Tidjanibacter sp.]